MSILQAIHTSIIFLFFMYALLEAVAILPRVAGSFLNSNSLGYTFSIMISTLKRIFIVSYPPLLGYMAINRVDVLPVILQSYLAGAIALLLVYSIRSKVILFFLKSIMIYKDGKSIFKSYQAAIKGGDVLICSDVNFDKSCGFDYSLVASASWIYFVYGSSLFVINIIGFYYQDNSAIVYQTIGLVNALGTLLMSFFLDPRISKNFDAKTNVNIALNSVLLGQLIALVLVGPLFVYALHSYLSLFLSN